MKLERIGSFNSADGHVGRTEPGIDASSVVKAGNRIFMSGQTGQPVSGMLPDKMDPAEFAERAMDSVTALLDQAGAGHDHRAHPLRAQQPVPHTR